MKRKFAKEYTQEWGTVYKKDGKVLTLKELDELDSLKGVTSDRTYSELKSVIYKEDGSCRTYHTKMSSNDLPETYIPCDRCVFSIDLIDAKGVKELRYSWVKENHFMKDSLLQVSFGDSNLDDEFGGHLVFGYSVFGYLAGVKKYSPEFDLSPVKNAFVEQCNWLAENEPTFAPMLDENNKTYGEWFDNKLAEIK